MSQPSQPVRFTMLGSGTSAGVPAIGCECAVCTSADPRDRRTRPAACLETIDRQGQPRVILLDASPDLREQVIRRRLRRCDAILFTHHHVDHVFGLDDVRRFNALMKAPIDVYGEPETIENLRRVYRHIFDAGRNLNSSFVATLIPLPLIPEQPIDLHGLRVTPIRLMHGRMPILGFRFDHAPDGARSGRSLIGGDDDDPFPLAYCTDVSAIPPETLPHLEGLHTLILDALRYRHHPTHFTVDQAIDTATRIGAERTFFTHMSHDILHADLDARLPRGINLGYDGLAIGTLPASASITEGSQAPYDRSEAAPKARNAAGLAGDSDE